MKRNNVIKQKIEKYLPSIIYSLLEVLVGILIGNLLGLKCTNSLSLILLFSIIRMVFKDCLHYKSCIKCFVWTEIFYCEMFLICKIDFLLSILFAIFSAFILTGRGNISDMFMWGGNKLNNNVYDWVKFNQDNEKLKQYEENLRKTDKKKYFIFIYRYREFKSYSDISKIMDIDIQRICDEINIMSHFIEYSIRLGED